MQLDTFTIQKYEYNETLHAAVTTHTSQTHPFIHVW